MKKTFLKIFALALILTSCSNEEIVNDNSLESKDSNLEKAGNLLPVKIITTGVNDASVSFVENFKYSGNKVASSQSSDGIKITYQYAGNNIVSKTYFDTNDNNKQVGTEKISYSSTNNPVKRVLNFKGGKLGNFIQTSNYDYSINNQVTIKAIARSEGKVIAKSTTIETFLNGNLIKSAFIADGEGVEVENYEYDNKKSPFTNVVGNKNFIGGEAGLGLLKNKNNVIKFSDKEGTIIFSKITFNTDGLPTKINESGSTTDNFVTKISYK
jgi:hypothetical protein